MSSRATDATAPGVESAAGEQVARSDEAPRGDGAVTAAPSSDTTLAAPAQDLRLAARWSVAQLPFVDPASYAIAGQIASGGVGRILRAHDIRLGRQVAIKEVLHDGDASAARFVREALLTARMQHPSIIPVYEAGRWPGGQPFYAMKLVTGRALHELIADSPALERRLALLPHVLAVAEAIAYAHAKRIIHRDLKPQNVLIGSFGETVVIDWGLAKDLAEEEPELPEAGPLEGGGAPGSGNGLTMVGAVMGTPAYMAPEQAAGRPADERTDVYSLGAILYHVLTGVPPYHDVKDDEVLRRARECPPSPASAVQAGIPFELRTILGKAMAREPGARYPTAAQLAEDLRRFQTGQIVSAHRYSPRERMWRFARKHRAALSVAAAALLVISLVAGVSVRRIIVERNRAARNEVESSQRADDLTLIQARTALDQDPNKAIRWLRSLSPSFSRWTEARYIAADAHARGLSTVLRGHGLAVNSAAFSPDGALLATTSDDRTVRLWRLSSGESRALLGHTDEIYDVQFSPGGEFLVTTSRDMTVRRWDPGTGDSEVVLRHEGKIEPLAMSEDGEKLATGSADLGIRVLDMRRGTSQVLSGHTAPVRALAFSPDGLLLASASDDRTARLWDLEGGGSTVLAAHAGTVHTVAFSPDGARLATGSADRTVRTWSLDTGESLVLTRHEEEVHDLVFSPDGALVASSDGGSTVHLIDVATGAVRALTGPVRRARNLRFSPDGAWLAAPSREGTLQLWNLESGESRTLSGFQDVLWSAAFSPDSRTVAATSWDHTARVFSLRGRAGRVLGRHSADILSSAVAMSPGGPLVMTAGEDATARLFPLDGGAPKVLRGHRSAVTAAAISPRGDLVATGGRDGTARVFGLDGREEGVFRRHAGTVTRVAISHDGGSVASADEEGRIELGDIDSGASRLLAGHVGRVNDLAFSPDGRVLASAGRDTTVRLWDVATGEGHVLRGHDDVVQVVAFSPDGELLASGGDDHEVRLWNREGTLVRLIEASGHRITQILFSRDGERLFILNNSNTVEIRSARSGGLLRALRGHEETVLHASLSPDGRTLATASQDRTVRLWDVESEASRVCRGHAGAVQQVWFSPDGKSVVSVGRDGTVRLWPDDLPESPAELRAWLDAAAQELVAR